MVQSRNQISNEHRGRVDIIADILRASTGGVKRTHLMYQCNLSFRQLKVYSQFLLSRGFLQQIARSRVTGNGTYRVTEKGKQFLKAYTGLKALMQ